MGYIVKQYFTAARPPVFGYYNTFQSSYSLSLFGFHLPLFDFAQILKSLKGLMGVFLPIARCTNVATRLKSCPLCSEVAGG